MYEYRKMTPEQREYVVALRRARRHPWHQPPHPETETPTFRLVSAACFEHRRQLNSPERLAWFEERLLGMLDETGARYSAWCVLPNHYHILVEVADAKTFSKAQGRLHGSTSRQLNKQDVTPGRRVWFRAQDRWMRSQRHFCTTLNYVHNNPVHHGLVGKWQEWPFSSAPWYLDTVGREWLVRAWREYPLRDYGAKWDYW